MDVAMVLKVVQMAISEILPDVMVVLRDLGEKPPHGIIHDRAEAKIGDMRGFLVWDYIVWNEITFDDEYGNIISFFNSISDKETKNVWNQLVAKYGIKKEDAHVQEDSKEDPR